MGVLLTFWCANARRCFCEKSLMSGWRIEQPDLMEQVGGRIPHCKATRDFSSAWSVTTRLHGNACGRDCLRAGPGAALARARHARPHRQSDTCLARSPRSAGRRGARVLRRHARCPGGERCAAGHRVRPRWRHHRTPVGGRRLHAHVRRPAAIGWGALRSRRRTSRVRSRACYVRRASAACGWHHRWACLSLRAWCRVPAPR